MVFLRFLNDFMWLGVNMELLYEDIVVLWAVFGYKKVALGHFWLTLGPLGGAYWTHDADMYGLVGPEERKC